MRIDFQKFDWQKLSVSDHDEYAKKRLDVTDKLSNKIDDVFNRLTETEVYLDKYLPYNSFVQLSEVLHVALEPKNLKKLEDYENAKLQNFLAEILLDIGRRNADFDKQNIMVPPPDPQKEKPMDCDCN